MNYNAEVLRPYQLRPGRYYVMCSHVFPLMEGTYFIKIRHKTKHGVGRGAWQISVNIYTSDERAHPRGFTTVSVVYDTYMVNTNTSDYTFHKVPALEMVLLKELYKINEGGDR